MTVEDKISMLESLSNIAPETATGEDEENLPANFLPLRSYSKLADHRVFLITGGRGAGKTALFRMITSQSGFDHIISEADLSRYTDRRDSKFIVGYTGRASTLFPGPSTCTTYAASKDEDIITAIWGGFICSSLFRLCSDEPEIEKLALECLGEDIFRKLTENSNQPGLWLQWMCDNIEKWEAFLDCCDNYFAAKSCNIYFVYDELDRICSKYADLFIYIRTLLSFWFTHNNRWRSLKAKIFLRSDLYNADALHFVDSSKMRAYHLELKWDSLSLYRLLVKRIANCGNMVAEAYLKEIPGLLHPVTKEALGYMPGDSEMALKAFIEKMIGKYMGKNPKKGLSYTWVPNHIQDANGDLSPRPFLKCFVFAAKKMIENYDEITKLEYERLLSPSSLQGALTEVSEDRVNELKLEEYGWLETLSNNLRRQSMLMTRQEFLRYLDPDLWSEEKRGTLPGNTPNELLEALKTLGIVIETGDGRINVPEIYLHGFGLKRRGGIKRPR
ncbi:MAG: hypothetical protein LUH04_08685 [Clostridium sp.]|nr:hypothetical protein [Clostridium sp.]